MAQATTTTTRTITNPINTKPESNQTPLEPPKPVLRAPKTSSTPKKGRKPAKSLSPPPSPSPSSSTSTSTAPATPNSSPNPSTSPNKPSRQQKKKRRARKGKGQPLILSVPPQALFHGSTTITTDRAKALQFAKTVYATQFAAQDPSASWHVFFADGSAKDEVPGATGAAVVYSRDGEVDNLVDCAYAVQDQTHIKYLEMFGIGAALRIALERISGRKGKKSESETESESEWSTDEERERKKQQQQQEQEEAEKESRKAHTHKVTVFSDSTDAIKCLRNLSPGQTTMGTQALEAEQRSTGRDLPLLVADISKRLADLGVEVELHWIPAHEDHPAHKQADLMAKAAGRYGANYLKGKVERTSRDKVIQVVDCGFLEHP